MIGGGVVRPMNAERRLLQLVTVGGVDTWNALTPRDVWRKGSESALPSRCVAPIWQGCRWLLLERDGIATKAADAQTRNGSRSDAAPALNFNPVNEEGPTWTVTPPPLRGRGDGSALRSSLEWRRRTRPPKCG